MLEHIERATDLRTWPGDMPVSHLYTVGVAGERFLRELKDQGRFMASRCQACDHTYVPPSIFCPTCFAALDEWTEVGPQGTLRAVTTAHRGLEGEPLEPPQTLAMIQLDGADDLLIHRMVEADGVSVGDRVEAVLEQPSQRRGSILDVRHFRPA